MPELPEVETVRLGLEKTIKGKTIKTVEIRLPKIIALGPATVSNIRKSDARAVAKFKQALQGEKITAVRRRAKMLILDLSGSYTILIHLKMAGQLIFASRREQPKLVKVFNTPNSRELVLPHKYTHVIITFTDGSKLFYNDLRQFGYLRLVHDNKISQVKELKDFGPEPTSREFTAKYLMEKAKRRPRIAVKTFLMDPKVVAGIGNIYSDEILFCVQVRPTRKAARITKPEWARIKKCTVKVLKDATKRQGSSVGDFFKIDGGEGTYGLVHKVYGRSKQKCRSCGTIIKSLKLGGRTGSFCPKCQN